MLLHVALRREAFPTAGNKTWKAAGRGTRGAFSLAGVSLAGVESLMAEGLADCLADGGSVELHLGPQPLALVQLLPHVDGGLVHGQTVSSAEAQATCRTLILSAL